MMYETIGSSKIKCSKIVINTWFHEMYLQRDLNQCNIADSVIGAYELGINTFDTAILYNDDAPEFYVANALKQIDRDKYYISTKAFNNQFDPKRIYKQCDKSLKNFNTDYIDLYQITPPNNDSLSLTFIAEAMDALNNLQHAGKIIDIGVAYFSAAQIKEALKYAIIVTQQPHSLSSHLYCNGTDQVFHENKLVLLACSSVVQKLLSLKTEPIPLVKLCEAHLDIPSRESINKFLFYNALFGAERYTEKYSTTFVNLALNWLTRNLSRFAVIPVTNLAQVTQIVKCFDFVMTEEDYKQLHILAENYNQQVQASNESWAQKMTSSGG